MHNRFSGSPLGALIVASLFSAAPCFAQSFKVGDQVEASPLAMNSKWEACVVTAILPGGDYGVACGPRRTEFAVQGRWVRPAAAPTPAQAPASANIPPQPASTVKSPTKVAPSQGDEPCRIGARVTDRENRSGAVVEANGPDCRVKLDSGTTRYYLAWMLKPEGAAPAAVDGGALTRGRYACWAAAGVAGTLNLEIKSDSTYAGNGKTGAYTYDRQTRKIAFQSGPWEGFHGARLESGKIGISSRPGGFYNTTCDLK